MWRTLTALWVGAVFLLTSGCGAYGTGLPNSDTPRKAYQVKLVVTGSSTKKTVKLNYFGHRPYREFTVGQRYEVTIELMTHERLQVTVRNERKGGTVAAWLQITRTADDVPIAANTPSAQDWVICKVYTGVLP